MFRLIATFLGAALAAGPVVACEGRPDALGTARELAVGPAQFPRVGRIHFDRTLPLAPKEVVLTFDDGPMPPSTLRVLDALRQECVRATFFLIGRNAATHPEIVRRIRAEGHTVAHHSHSHPMLSRLPPDKAEADIDRGIAAVEAALGSKGEPAPFFRFPFFASSPALLERLEKRGYAVFGADLWASDWNLMTPDSQLDMVMRRLRKTEGGIVLMHDTRAQTAAMIPALLRALKREGFRIVHAVPAGRADMARRPHARLTF
ncbi:MAG: polysaccharide deacetylase family protein [Pseudorhodoplanes sp.]|nr:polysaccharide deacetylase family protein [Pseudorhodoplanes sp.]